MIEWSLADDAVGFYGAGTKYISEQVAIIDDTPVVRTIDASAGFSHSHKYFAQEGVDDGTIDVLFWIDCGVSAGGEEQKVNVSLIQCDSEGTQIGDPLIDEDVVVDANTTKQYTSSSASLTDQIFSRADCLVLEFSDAVGDSIKKLRYLGKNDNDADSRIETQNSAWIRRIKT